LTNKVVYIINKLAKMSAQCRHSMRPSG